MAMLGFLCIRNQSLILLQLRTMVTQIFISQHFSYTFTFQGWSVNNIEHHLFDLLILRKDLGSDINASRPLHAAKPLNSSSGLEGGMQLQWDGDGDGDGLCCILPTKWPGVCGPKRKSAWAGSVQWDRWSCAGINHLGPRLFSQHKPHDQAFVWLASDWLHLPRPYLIYQFCPYWKKGQEMFDWGKKCNVKYLALTKAVWGPVCCMQVYILLVHCLDKWHVLPEMSARFLGFLCSSCISDFFAVHLLVLGEENGNTTA